MEMMQFKEWKIIEYFLRSIPSINSYEKTQAIISAEDTRTEFK